jgi:hypothetical protein
MVYALRVRDIGGKGMDTTTQDAKAYLQRWADMDVVSVTENEDGSVDLFLVSLLGSGFEVHIEARRVG